MLLLLRRWEKPWKWIEFRLQSAVGERGADTVRWVLAGWDKPREVRGWGKQKSVFQAVASTRYTPLLFPHNHNYTYTNLLGPGGITNRVKLSLSTLAFSCKKCKINNFGNKTWRRRKPQSQYYTGENKGVKHGRNLFALVIRWFVTLTWTRPWRRRWWRCAPPPARDTPPTTSWWGACLGIVRLWIFCNFSARRRSRRSSIRSLAPVGTWWWVRDSDLSSVMKWRSSSICSLPEHWRFVYGDVHEETNILFNQDYKSSWLAYLDKRSDQYPVIVLPEFGDNWDLNCSANTKWI